MVEFLAKICIQVVAKVALSSRRLQEKPFKFCACIFTKSQEDLVRLARVHLAEALILVFCSDVLEATLRAEIFVLLQNSRDEIVDDNSFQFVSDSTWCARSHGEMVDIRGVARFGSEAIHVATKGQLIIVLSLIHI